MMEWISLKTWEYRRQARGCWHKWFAWYPVTIHTFPDGAEKVVWLAGILRRGEWWSNWGDSGWIYEYKELHETR